MHIPIPENLHTTILPIKAFKDNYIWIIIRNNFGVIVDPGESSQVIKFNDNNSIVNTYTNKCVQSNGSYLILSDCNTNNKNQNFFSHYKP